MSSETSRKFGIKDKALDNGIPRLPATEGICTWRTIKLVQCTKRISPGVCPGIDIVHGVCQRCTRDYEQPDVNVCRRHQALCNTHRRQQLTTFSAGRPDKAPGMVNEDANEYFHPDKCHVLHLGQLNPQNIYHMNNASGSIYMLDVVTSEKDLGVTIDHQLKFSDHIENAVKKANRVLGCLGRTFRHLNKDTFLLLYKAMVRPRLEYASCVWCPHLKKDSNVIEQVQRRATRLTTTD